MKTFALVLPCVMALLTMERCAQPAAVDPRPGDIQGEWRVNLGRQRSFGQGTPLLVELRLHNSSDQTVYLPALITPMLAERSPESLVWTPLQTWPRKLRSGDSIPVLWSLDSSLEAGDYQLQLFGESADILEVQAVQFSIEAWQASPLLRDYYASLKAHYEKNGGDLLPRLRDQATDPNAPPSVHLQLAELLESTGDVEGAKQHYRRFAEKTFGTEAIPGWLLAKIEGR